MSPTTHASTPALTDASYPSSCRKNDPGRTTGSMTVTQATSQPVLSFRRPADVASLWREMEARDPETPLAASWEWIETWLRHFGPVVRSAVAVLERDDRPVALALVCEERLRKGPFRLTRAHVGTAGEPAGESVHVEYNALLGAPDARAELAAALVRELHAGRWDELALDGFTEAGADDFVRADGGFELEPEPAPFAALGGDVVEALRSSIRQRVRRSLRGFGEVHTEWAETPERALAILDELVELHQRRWSEAGEAGAFAGE